MTVLNDIRQLNEQVVLAIGTFDGVHIGHQDVLSVAAEIAQNTNQPLAILTFNSHPVSILEPEKVSREIISVQQKREILAEFDPVYIVEQDFGSEFAEITARDFIKFVGQNQIVIGENFHFGKGGLGSAWDFPKGVVRPLLTLAEGIVSSTRIREEISLGRIELAEKMLGRPFVLQGMVVRGNGRGRTLGFPTANVEFGKYVIPAFGAYAVRIATGDKYYRGIANVGNNPTFKGDAPRLEVHLFDFDGNLYNRRIGVEFVHYLRPEICFTDGDDLKKQIEKDKINACTYF